MSPPTRPVLVLNTGSSSVKFAVVDPDSGRRPVSGLAERVGTSGTTLVISTGSGKEEQQPEDTSLQGVLALAVAALEDHDVVGLAAVGHRVVQGGARYSDAVLVDDEVEQALEDLASLAPVHMPANLAGIARRPRRLPRPAAGGGLRHRLPPDDAADGLPLRRARGVVRRARRAPLRLPRHQPPLRQRPCRRAARPPARRAAHRHRAPRQRLQRRRGARRAHRSTRRWA